jgi:hypothetical protein
VRILALLWLLIPAQVLAQDGIVVRTSVTPERAWVGQRVILRIDVLAEDGWAQIPALGDLGINGAYVVRNETQGTRLSEGASTGQRYQLSVYPQVAGRLEIPALPVTVTVKRWGVGGGDEEHELLTPPTTLQTRIPPGAESVRGLVTSSSLVADQSWSAQPDTVQLGDAVTRTVTLRAENVSGMAFPPLRHGAIEGAGIYPGEPRVEDSFNRGSLSGERVETVTYVVEKPGAIRLPGIRVNWWNPESETLRIISLDGLDFVAIGTPDSVAAVVELPLDEARPRWPWFAGGAFVLVALAWRLRGPLEAWRARRRQSEGRYFADAMRAVRSGDAGQGLNGLMRWLDRIEDGKTPARMDRFLDHHGDETACAEANRLLDCVGRGVRLDDAGKVVGAFSRARKNWRSSVRRRRAASAVLPELNG